MVNWKRAMCLVAKEKVQVLAYSEQTVKTAEGACFKIPAVIKLIKLIRTLYRARVPFSKKNVFVRDGYRCAYCGARKFRLTIDHIIPKSRGGRDDFDNCVASCKKCNTRKGNKTPREAGMSLRVKPYQPTISEFLRLKIIRLGIHETLKDLGVY
ncbi:HNH endonuclease [Desulfonema ishimotonii]|nr:HNH endonuclease [Desulfonema ishimotonii]